MARNDGISRARVDVTVGKAFVQGKAGKKRLASGLKPCTCNLTGPAHQLHIPNLTGTHAQVFGIPVAAP